MVLCGNEYNLLELTYSVYILVILHVPIFFFFFLNDPPPPEFSPLPLHAAFPIWVGEARRHDRVPRRRHVGRAQRGGERVREGERRRGVDSQGTRQVDARTVRLVARDEQQTFRRDELGAGPRHVERRAHPRRLLSIRLP